jgi:putative SOS response-associated peptidase YedK
MPDATPGRLLAAYHPVHMCGRFSQSESSRRLAEVFRAKLADGLPDGSYNVAPTATIRIVVERDEERRIEPAQWGFRPPWPARNGKAAPPWINAKAETAAESRAFGPALRKRRCIIPVDAFYEWDQHTKPKQPYAVGATDGTGLLALAGIWSPSHEPDDLPTVAILTTAPNELMARIHHRQPVVLPLDAVDEWFGSDPAPMLGAIDAAAIRMWPVSSEVNRAGNDGPQLLEPVAAPATLGLADA